MPFAGNYRFLTTKPLTRRIYEEQQEYMYILALEDIADAELDVTINYTDATTTNYQVEIGDIDKGEIRCLNIGFGNMDYKSYQPTKTISKIQLKVDNDLEKVVMYPMMSRSDYNREFHYFNSLGGMDSLFCTGDYLTEQETNYEESRSDLAINASLSDAEYASYNNMSREVYSVYSGFKPMKEIEALKDMFLVNKVYELVKAHDVMAMFPVIIDQKSVKYPSSQTNLKSVDFKCRQAYDDIALDRVL